MRRSLQTASYIASIVSAVALVALVVIVATASPRRIDGVIRVLEEIRDKRTLATP